MSSGMIAAASRMADLLEQENAALAVLDLARAAAMLADKQCAAARLAAAQAVPLGAADQATAQRITRRLLALAEANRALLERAIAVQGRVIGLIARAAPRATEAPRYGARGCLAHAGRPTAFTLAARA